MMTKESKAEAIREALKGLGRDASPKQVIALLKERRLEVTAQQVSNEKAKLRVHPATTDLEHLPVSVLKKVKSLVEELGSAEIVRRALDELAELGDAPQAS